MSQNLPQGLFALLTGDSGVAALIATRMYPVELPEGEQLPALLYRFVGGKSSPTLTTSGMQRARVQFDCFGDTYDDASSLRAAVVGALNGYVGTLADGTELQNADVMGPGTDFFDDDPRSFRCMVEFYLYYTLQT